MDLVEQVARLGRRSAMKKDRGTVSPQRRLCCTTFIDQPHRRDCAFKRRSIEYNAELKQRLAAARTRGSQKAVA